MPFEARRLPISLLYPRNSCPDLILEDCTRGYQFEIYELMIARQWSGWAPKERAPEYLNLFSGQVQPKLNAIRGFRRSLVLVREHGEETEIVTITFFERLEDIVAFAGDQYEMANVSSEARAILSRFDEAVSHFEVALQLP
jgi:heme-degrading monooxygenase HmoA